MATAPINKPTLVQSGKTWPATRAEVTDASNSFVAQQFVKLSSGALAECASEDTVVYGLVLDDSHTATAEPYTAPFGQLHSPLDVQEGEFLVNITDTSGAVGSGSTTQADVTVGTAYGLLLGSGDYDGIAFLNKDDTTNDFFKVERLWPDDATTDFNGRVVCSIVADRQ